MTLLNTYTKNPLKWKFWVWAYWKCHPKSEQFTFEFIPRIRFKVSRCEGHVGTGDWDYDMHNPTYFYREIYLKIGWLFGEAEFMARTPEYPINKADHDANLKYYFEEHKRPYTDMQDYYKRYYGYDIPNEAFTEEYAREKLKLANSLWPVTNVRDND